MIYDNSLSIYQVDRKSLKIMTASDHNMKLIMHTALKHFEIDILELLKLIYPLLYS